MTLGKNDGLMMEKKRCVDNQLDNSWLMKA